MKPENTTLLEPVNSLTEIDLSPVEIPPRSRLISLKPLGLATPEIESLWSYTHRLSEAHSLRFFDFILYFISDYKKILFKSVRDSNESGVWKHLVEAMSGPTFGSRVAGLLDKLTGRSGLRNLTLTPVCAIPSLTIRPRSGQVWCPQCLAEDAEPYERLLWSISDVTHCNKHGGLLEHACQNCGKQQKTFSATSSIHRCVYCGLPKCQRVIPLSKSDRAKDIFGRWASGEVAKLLQAVSDSGLSNAHIDIRNHNLDLSSKIPDISGITCLSLQLGAGRNTARDWLKNNRGIPLKEALRWSWLSGVGLTRLLTVKLTDQDLNYRPLPPEILTREKTVRKSPVPVDSPALYLATLKLAAANPFKAPRRSVLTAISGVHVKHPAFKDSHYLKLIHRLRERERIFFRKERVWREVSEVHAAAIKVVKCEHRLSRSRVGREMEKPGCFCGHLARAYLAWFKKRLKQGDKSLLQPKQIPVDVRAYWNFKKSENNTKGG